MFPFLSNISKIDQHSLPATNQFMKGIRIDYNKVFHDLPLLLFKQWNSINNDVLMCLDNLTSMMDYNLNCLKNTCVMFKEPTYFEFQSRMISLYKSTLIKVDNLNERIVKHDSTFESCAKIIYDIDKYLSYFFGQFYVNDVDTKIEFGFILWNTQKDINLAIFKYLTILCLNYSTRSMSKTEDIMNKIGTRMGEISEMLIM